MTLTVYRAILFGLYGVGFLTATVYLGLYRAWHLRKWGTVAARESSGLILVLWLLYGWLIYRLIDATLAGRGSVPHGSSLWVGFGFLLLIDGYFVQRLVHYWQFLAEERKHPTRICHRCAGRGVVLVGTPRDHFDIPFTE